MGYGDIVRPLTFLLRKDQFKWSEEAREAFQKLKVAMSTVLVLALPNFKEQFMIESNASGMGRCSADAEPEANCLFQSSFNSTT